MNKVAISNGNSYFHLFESANAAIDNNMLYCFISSFSVSSNFLYEFLQYVDKMNVRHISKKANKLRNRFLPKNSPYYLFSIPLAEIYFQLSFVVRAMLYYRTKTHGFFGKVGFPEIYHVRAGYGGGTIDLCHSSNSLAIVDHSAMHPQDIIDLNKHLYGGKIYSTKLEKQLRIWELVEEDINNSDYIIANSDCVKSSLIKHKVAPNKIKIIYLGIPEKLLNIKIINNKSSEKIIILFIGLLTKSKGLHIFLEIAKRFMNYNNISFIAIGNHADDTDELIKNLPINVLIKPQLHYEELIQNILNADIFLYPSLLDGSARIVMEVMALAKPVITTLNSGSVIEDGKDGFICQTDDIIDYVDRINYLITNPKESEILGLSARKKIKDNYCSINYRENIIRLYSGIRI